MQAPQYTVPATTLLPRALVVSDAAAAAHTAIDALRAIERCQPRHGGQVPSHGARLCRWLLLTLADCSCSVCQLLLLLWQRSCLFLNRTVLLVQGGICINLACFQSAS